VLPCAVELNFENGEAFISAGLGLNLAPNTERKLHLVKQLPQDSLSSDALKSLATIISGLTIVLALLTPFLSVGLGQI
jgi:hypothetical protein